MEKSSYELFKQRIEKAEIGTDFLADLEKQLKQKDQLNYLEYIKAKKTVRDYEIDLEHLTAVESLRIRESLDKKITEAEIKDRINANQEIFKMKKTLSDLKFEAEKLLSWQR